MTKQKGSRKRGKNYITVDKAVSDSLDSFGSRIDALSGKIKENEKKSDDELKLLKEESKNTKRVVDVGTVIMLGVIVVFFIAIIGFGYDYYKYHGESFTDLKKSVDNLRGDINNKNYEILLMKIDSLEDEIKELKENKDDNG